MNDFGERLKDLRVQNDMTQEDVASKLFVTKQAVSRWENGNCLPDVATLGKLAELFDVNIDYLLTGNDNVKIEKEIEIVEKEKIVEVEKEKIVEVEKPLSDEDKERMLYKFNRIKGSLYVYYCLIVSFIIITVIFSIKSPYALIAGAFALLVAIPATIYTHKLYKKEKEAIRKYDETINNDNNNNNNEIINKKDND